MTRSNKKHRIQGFFGPRGLLHLDGLALLAGSIFAYVLVDGRWWLFAALLFAPDLFMLGYLTGPRIGALVYNLGHSKLIPVILVTTGILMHIGILIEIGIIYFAHIGMDHLFGYGFKYKSEFKDTHFSRV